MDLGQEPEGVAVSFDADIVIYYFTGLFVVWVGGFLAGYVVSWFRRILNDAIL